MSETEIVVVGGGPGGYAAAFYAADKGRKVTLVEADARLGGVCLTKGCIPSKALLHATQIIRDAAGSKQQGVSFGPPLLDLNQMRGWKESVIDKLAKGLSGLAQKRGVQVARGRGYFEDSQTLRIEMQEGQRYLRFEKAIVAVGSKPMIPAAFDLGNKRIMTSTEALEIEEIPGELLVVGGGYIGLELGTVYAALGSKVVLVEAMGSLLAGVDPDLVRPVARYAEKAFAEVRLQTKVLKMETSGKRIKVIMETAGQKKEELFDKVLVSIGRVPNCSGLGLENTKVTRDEKGFIQVDARQGTSDPAIYAIGDAAGGALLAHKAHKEAKVAVEAIAGEESSSEGVVIPAVVFTDPEIAWAGLSETEAREKGIAVEVTRFPWSASGRALTMDRPDGLTKLVIERETERIIGVGIVGRGAGELISEGVLAMEMGATARDLAESVHPHPTLSETLMEAAEIFYGTATSVFARRLMLVLSFSMVALCARPLFADTLYLKGKGDLKGVIVQENAERYILSTINGEKEVPKDQVRLVEYDDREQSYYQLGLDFQRVGRLQEALEVYKTAVKLRPDFQAANEAVFNVERLLRLEQESQVESEVKKKKTLLDQQGEVLQGPVKAAGGPADPFAGFEKQFGCRLRYENGSVLFTDIEAGGPAAAAGLRVEDTLYSVWGDPVGQISSGAISGKLSSGAAEMELAVERTIRLEPSQRLPGGSIGADFELGYDGLRVSKLQAGSPAEARLAVGDLVIMLDDQTTRYMSLAKVRALLGKGGPVMLRVRRNIVLRKVSSVY